MTVIYKAILYIFRSYYTHTNILKSGPEKAHFMMLVTPGKEKKNGSYMLTVDAKEQRNFRVCLGYFLLKTRKLT